MKIILNIISFILLFGLSPLVHADVVPPPQPIKLFGLEQIPVKCKDIEGWRCIGEYYVDDNYNKKEPVNSSQVEGSFDLASAVEEDKLIVLEKDGYYKETEIDSFNKWVKSRTEKLNSQERKKQIIYHNEEGRFSFTLPVGCQEMPPNILKTFSKLLDTNSSSGFWGTGENDYFFLIKITKEERIEAGDLQILSAVAVKRTSSDWSTVFKDVQKLKPHEFMYDEIRHIRYEKSEINIPSKSSRVPGVNVLIFSNYGEVAMSFYSAKKFDESAEYFNQVINSFKFMKGYEYPNEPHKSYYHNADGHFSIKIPEGWFQLSSSELQQFAESMSKFSGKKQELAAGFFDKDNSDIYSIVNINATGRRPESNFEKLISNGRVNAILQTATSGLPAGIKFAQPFYDEKRHILYMPLEFSDTLGISATFLSNYGLVTMAFYAPKKDFDVALGNFKKIIDSFNFDEGYRYLDGYKASKVNAIIWEFLKIKMPCLPAMLLLFMGISCYREKINWRDIKGSWREGIKLWVVILLALIINGFDEFLRASDFSPTFKDCLEVGITIFIGIFWYKQYKKIKKE